MTTVICCGPYGKRSRPPSLSLVGRLTARYGCGPTRRTGAAIRATESGSLRGIWTELGSVLARAGMGCAGQSPRAREARPQYGRGRPRTAFRRARHRPAVVSHPDGRRLVAWVMKCRVWSGLRAWFCMRAYIAWYCCTSAGLSRQRPLVNLSRYTTA